MAGLYPNLHDRFKAEGVCPICFMEMELAPRYSCANEHTICLRCKPFYYGCPTCLSPLELETPPPHGDQTYQPPPTHFMPHPVPGRYREQVPSAPPVDNFYTHERQAWSPPMPQENQELKRCPYAHLGCWVNVPEYLQELHESRCQFRPHLEEEHLPTDLHHGQDDQVECTYKVVGCNVRTTPWRINIHENHCIYKDKYEAMSNITESLDHVTITDEDCGDPDELLECKYRRYGCMVNMRRRRKKMHEQKCNYSKYHQADDEDDEESPEEDYSDPNEQVQCVWAEYGCRVKPKRSRKETHEEKCNYRMVECPFKDLGCNAMLHPSRKYAHEKVCGYAN